MSGITFKIGDIVELKSSSPDMTITDISGEYLQCTYWIENNSEFGTINVHQDAVDKAED